jgi:hypothetical protein
MRLNPVVQFAGLSVEPVIVTVGVPHASDAVGEQELDRARQSDLHLQELL